MSHLNSKGPDEEGAASGRGLGRCNSAKNKNWTLGLGMGMRRRSGNCGEGHAKRLKSGKIFDNEKKNI